MAEAGEADKELEVGKSGNWSDTLTRAVKSRCVSLCHFT